MAEVKLISKIICNLFGIIIPVIGRRINANDIGVISPYRGQVNALSRNIRNNDVHIGTTENFQGSEKPVIIISTVRVGEIGFLKNPRVTSNHFQFSKLYLSSFNFFHFYFENNNYQRFNVAVTRAKCLLIIVGHKPTLQKDANWDAMIEFCANNGCIRH